LLTRTSIVPNAVCASRASIATLAASATSMRQARARAPSSRASAERRRNRYRRAHLRTLGDKMARNAGADPERRRHDCLLADRRALIGAARNRFYSGESNQRLHALLASVSDQPTPPNGSSTPPPAP